MSITRHYYYLVLTFHLDTVTDFSWEPKGERFAIISTSDPNLGNPAPGITIKTDVSFYQLVRGKGDFKLLRTYHSEYVGDLAYSLMHCHARHTAEQD